MCMMAFKAPTLGVVGWPDRVFGFRPVIEDPVTQSLWGHMLETQVKFLLSTAALLVLPVLADANGSPQSDVSTPVVQPSPNIERLMPLADFWAAWTRLPGVSQWLLRTI